MVVVLQGLIHLVVQPEALLQQVEGGLAAEGLVRSHQGLVVAVDLARQQPQQQPQAQNLTPLVAVVGASVPQQQQQQPARQQRIT